MLSDIFSSDHFKGAIIVNVFVNFMYIYFLYFSIETISSPVQESVRVYTIVGVS